MKPNAGQVSSHTGGAVASEKEGNAAPQQWFRLKAGACAIGLLTLTLCVPSLAQAEMEKIATPNDHGMHFYWWPDAAPPKGWVQDKKSSFAYSSKTFVAEGTSFANAETVMYAKANYKPRQPEIKTLEEMILSDQKDFLTDPNIELKGAKPITAKDGHHYISYYYAPKGEGNWERVAYGEEGEYFVTFVISSRTKAGLESNEAAFLELVTDYKQ